MKILYLSQEYTPHDWRFLDALSGGGNHVWYLRLEEGPSLLEQRPLPPRVKVVPRNPNAASVSTARGRRQFGVEMKDLLKEVHPDVVHAGPVHPCGFLAAQAGFQPLVLASWASDLLVHAHRDAVVRRESRTALHAAQVVVGDCQAVREKIRDIAEIPGSRIVTFPWGVDLSLFRPARSSSRLRREWGWEDRTVIVSTRTWESPYQVSVLLRAFRRLHTHRPDLRLLLVGDGAQADRIRAFVRSHGLENVVAMPGRIPNPDLPQYLTSADVYVSTAPSDGSSVSLMEAFACGLPVIVADNQGNREWVTPGRNGHVFQPGDAASLAGAMSEMLALPSGARTTMRRRNAALARRRADWNVNSARLLEAFKRALNGNGGRRRA